MRQCVNAVGWPKGSMKKSMENKERYRKIHWEVYRKIAFKVNEKWYKHEPEKLVENDSARYYRMLQFKRLMSLR